MDKPCVRRELDAFEQLIVTSLADHATDAPSAERLLAAVHQRLLGRPAPDENPVWFET
ncbi:hypothetical protein AB0L70_23300 [Kribbella sp. NPDC051952]|uniref:hypothetical protein n=1 Tax=Kribbella sp. NPDC051952 TaxID=3154851 RepID=UPI003443B6E6